LQAMSVSIFRKRRECLLRSKREGGRGKIKVASRKKETSRLAAMEPCRHWKGGSAVGEEEEKKRGERGIRRCSEKEIAPVSPTNPGKLFYLSGKGKEPLPMKGKGERAKGTKEAGRERKRTDSTISTTSMLRRRST